MESALRFFGFQDMGAKGLGVTSNGLGTDIWLGYNSLGAAFLDHHIITLPTPIPK